MSKTIKDGSNKDYIDKRLTPGVDGSVILDEDDMISDSDTKVPTQQSTKAYADATATDKVAELDELADGVGTKVNTAVSGFVKIDNVAKLFYPKNNQQNTTSETSLVNTLPTYAANEIEEGVDVIEIDIGGQLINNSGGAVDYIFRLKVGGLTARAFTVSAVPASATQRNWYMKALIRPAEFFGTTRLFGPISFGVGDAGTGVNFANYTNIADAGAGSVDLTSTVGIDLSVQMSTAATTVSTLMHAGYVRTFKAA